MAGAETTSVVQELHPESQYLYRTAYTLLTAKNPLKVTHHGAKEHGDPGQRGTDGPSEDDRVALRLVGRHGPVVRQHTPELRGPLLGRPPPARWTDSDLRVRQPLVDLIDKGSEFVVRAELPGVAKEDVDLTVTADGIEIRAETNRSREEKEKNYQYRERMYQALQRVLSFP